MSLNNEDPQQLHGLFEHVLAHAIDRRTTQLIEAGRSGIPSSASRSSDWTWRSSSRYAPDRGAPDTATSLPAISLINIRLRDLLRCSFAHCECIARLVLRIQQKLKVSLALLQGLNSQDA
jgi:hypothetical protein